MKNLFSQSLDVVDHVINSDFEKIATLVEPLSAKAKTAYIPTYEEDISRADKDFAVVLLDAGHGKMHKYACYNSELTELNMQFLADSMSKLPEELVKIAGANLTCAAKKFKLPVPEELKKYASSRFVNRILNVAEIKEVAFIEKTAHKIVEPDKIYALEGKYPIHTPGHITKAAEWFDKNHTKLSVDQIKEFVINIIKEAELKKVDLDKTAINKYASLDYDNFNPDFYNLIQIRKRYLTEDDEDTRNAYNDVVRRADEIGPVKLAYVIEYIDKEAGLNEIYNTKLTDPLQTVFGMKKLGGVDIDGTKVCMADIKKLKNEDLTPIVGNDIIKELKGDMGLEILASLPKPVRQELLGLM